MPCVAACRLLCLPFANEAATTADCHNHDHYHLWHLLAADEPLHRRYRTHREQLAADGEQLRRQLFGSLSLELVHHRLAVEHP